MKCNKCNKELPEIFTATEYLKRNGKQDFIYYDGDIAICEKCHDENNYAKGYNNAIDHSINMLRLMKEGRNTMTETAPILEVAQAVAETIANPSMPILAEDLLLAHKLANEVKAALAGKHPSLSLIFQTLFNLP